MDGKTRKEKMAPPPTLNRLNALLASGYRIAEGSSHLDYDFDSGSMRLEHPARQRIDEWELLIYNDGTLIDQINYDLENRLKIKPDAHEKFNWISFDLI